jgi:hypothetical protein
METLVAWILALVGIYLACGLVFGLVFVWRGVSRIDPMAASAGLGFRLLIMPACAVFWPMLWLRWLRGISPPPIEDNAHRRLAREAKR